MTTVLFGGPYDGAHVLLSDMPARILVNDVPYVRVDDPDTGEHLGGYVVEVEHV